MQMLTSLHGQLRDCVVWKAFDLRFQEQKYHFCAVPLKSPLSISSRTLLRNLQHLDLQ